MAVLTRAQKQKRMRRDKLKLSKTYKSIKFAKVKANGVVLKPSLQKLANQLPHYIISDIRKCIALYAMPNTEAFDRTYSVNVGVPELAIFPLKHGIDSISTSNNTLYILNRKISSIRAYNASNGIYLYEVACRRYVEAFDSDNTNIYTIERHYNIIGNNYKLTLACYLRDEEIYNFDISSYVNPNIRYQLKVCDDKAFIISGIGRDISVIDLGILTRGSILYKYIVYAGSNDSKVNDFCIYKNKTYAVDVDNECIYVNSIKTGRFISKIPITSVSRSFRWGLNTTHSRNKIISIYDNEIFILNWNNDIISVHGMKGNAIRYFGDSSRYSESLHSPTDFSIFDGEIFVANQKPQSIRIFS
jgi:hypothetical protein